MIRITLAAAVCFSLLVSHRSFAKNGEDASCGAYTHDLEDAKAIVLSRLGPDYRLSGCAVDGYYFTAYGTSWCGGWQSTYELDGETGELRLIESFCD